MIRLQWFLVVAGMLTILAPVCAAAESSEEFLPIGLTEEEKGRLHEIGQAHRSTRAPEGDLRNPAEWERSEGVIIRWPLGIPVSLVAELSEDLMVTTIVANSSAEASAISSYSSGGVNMSNVQFLYASTNSIWTRDYGPWFIFEDEQLAIVDHIYNRPRPLDDVIPQILGDDWGLTVYGMDLITTGGNHMSDGLGMSMSTRLVYDENPNLDAYQVDSVMLANLGNDYTVLAYIESGGIHHIDCWAKFLSPTTILVKDVPSSSSSYALLNARAAFLAQQTSAWGQPYTVVRVYCPTGTAYTNAIILNDKVFVPTFGGSYDDDAIQTYQNAMPGYEILGFSGSWYDDDAIHCRTMGVPDREMLFIDHVPLSGEHGDPFADYDISAYMSAFSDSALVADSLKILFRVDGGAWISAPLTTGAEPHVFEGAIPAQATGSLVEYYLQAADRSGRVETHPFIGASWAHRFEVGGPHAPSAPVAQYPQDPNGQPLYDMLPTFVWAAATDPDANDTIRYRLELSLDEGFTSPTVIDSIPGAGYQAADSLLFNARYWWRVTAFDRTGLEAVSNVESFWTWTLGDIDVDHQVTMGDLTRLIDHLFISFEAITPPRIADVDGDCEVTMGDLTIIIDHLFISFSPLTVPGCE